MTNCPRDLASDRRYSTGDDDDIAICDISINFPGDAVSPEAFWQMLMEKRCVITKFPASRFNKGGFYRKEKSLNTIPVKGGHFVQEDLSVFDAGFFSISPAEAAAIDPMQRWLLRRHLEHWKMGPLTKCIAGIAMNDVTGSSTSVSTGSFGFDYSIQLNRDAEFPPLHAGLGFGISMLANRLSWFFEPSWPKRWVRFCMLKLRDGIRYGSPGPAH
ncbi:thiolase-like protein [Biscogniauxia mediterranea]|nr:thiolase-like protein [Biscogniauxia mediterranea]